MLKSFVDASTNGAPASPLVIVPHNRPWQYFSRLYAQKGGSLILPKMLSFTEIVAIWRNHAARRPAHIATTLEQAGLLHQCVCSLATEDPILAAGLAKMDMEKFLPWGLRLSALLEEMFIHGVEAKDLAHMEDEVAKPAADLLGALGRIASTWRGILGDRNWTTPGLDHFIAMQDADNIPPLLLPRENRPVFIAGFYALNGAENRLFHTLWQAGAHICLHTDPAMATGEPLHNSCREHAAWLRRWHGKPEPVIFDEILPQAPEIKFFSGYDYHSQLNELPKILEKESSSTAIILSQPDLLMPVLHHLPDKNVNISMGYPLDRTPLSNLLEDIFKLQENRIASGDSIRYYWRDLLRLIRQPFLNMLVTASGSSLRPALGTMAKLVGSGEKYVDLEAVANLCASSLDGEEAALFRECLDCLAIKPADMDSISSMATCLRDILNFLIAHGGEVWKRFPLDAEAMTHLRNNVINPLLANSVLAHEKFSIPALHGILRQLHEAERVPFEAFPLVGVQLLGMLESRLLHFRRVLIMDACDDVLPGNPEQNPLLPDSLRALVGLPDGRTRENVTAHNLWRLCMGAEEVYFSWEEGISHSGLFDGKKTRSRFVEQLIWQREKDAGRLFTTGEPPLYAANVAVHMEKRTAKTLAKTAAIQAALERYLARGISSTSLDLYLTCPLHFAWKNLLGLAPQAEVLEDEDPSLVGTCVHAALRSFYEPYLGSTVRRHELNPADLARCFAEQARGHNLREKLPAPSWLMLDLAAGIRLKQFLEAQPEETRITALEKRLEITMDICGSPQKFHGIIDRMDERDGQTVLLDYKTGSLKLPVKGFWHDDDFFQRLAKGLSAPGPDMELLDELREKMPSLQLPFYITLLGGQTMGDAAFVELKDSGAEKSLFYGLEDDEKAIAAARCRLIIQFVPTNMKKCVDFRASESESCKYCDFTGMCHA